VLAWGPAFEPHRYPDGAEIGSRLPLRPGTYRLRIEAELLPADAPNRVVVRPEGTGVAADPRWSPFTRTPGSLEAVFLVRESETAVTLLLAGPPLFLRRITLELQPPQGSVGPIGAGGVAAAARLTPSEPR
jgi:hypothetical protein